ncbi:MAG: hypothetical protein M1840_008848 [Geoglossum simile]|nr:MAG: hypothetical protein M1840_008848 [Geoglossum simile]
MAVVSWLGSSLSANATASTSATAVLVAVALIAFTTRLFCSFLKSQRGEDGVWSVGVVPYWFPFLGHIPAFAADQYAFLSRLRDASAHGIFAINLGGSIHNLACTPSLVRSIFAQTSSVESEDIAMFMLNRAFGMPRSFNKTLSGMAKDLSAVVHKCLMREPGLGKMSAGTMAACEEHTPNLVSFASSPIDQSLWERESDVDVWHGLKDTGEPDLAVEANLFSLLRNFVGHVATPSLMGQAFMDYYPEVLRDIWDLEYGLMYLVAGIPRWVPIPTLGRAHRAQNKLNRRISEFHLAMDLAEDGRNPGPEWRDFSDVSDVIKGRHRVWRDANIPPHLRSDVAILWAMNANANNLCFWMVLHILATPDLVDRIRAEVEPHVQASQPDNILGLTEPPMLKMSLAGLKGECPLLKSCYFETLRFDSATWSIKRIVKDFTITAHGKDGLGGTKSFALKSGEYVSIPSEVHQSDPRYFPSPESFMAERFLTRKPDGTTEADIGTLRPYGGGLGICKGKVFAEGEVLACVAGIIALWDFEPIGADGWQIPHRVRASGVTLPKTDVRVRIRRRKLP